MSSPHPKFKYCIKGYIRVFLIIAYTDDSLENDKIKAVNMIVVV